MVRPDRAAWGRVLRRARPLSAAEAARAGGWLILAPHPDDETLGAGGLIAALSDAGARVAAAFLTDGAASHVGAPGWSPARIAAARAGEAGAALRVLGLAVPPLWLGWRDAAPPAPDTDVYRNTVARLVALCRRRRLRQVVASWSGDPHCDHAAAARIAADVAAALGVVPRFYAVWGWTRPDLDARLARTRALALPVARWRGRARRALACHRSQLGGRIHGAREAFVLPRTMRALVDLPYALLLEPRDAS
ncbi:PIG-L deacetylase family protein [Sphingomonas morindae]|uniref:PIG-L family deacetylase n=1 Tax=Sphingomonas morindae TaxID=1541170 RepID=A0ABY4XD52_9SPHN|nr:PIG-L family deacetylase [Sphingomonas morindae]USI74896.1 PIG-L family deacetylase [Sphingomonas morindae]